MAQFGRALRSGRRGRRFKSCHSDHVGAKFALLRFSVQKNIRPLPCSSFIAKGHVHVGYSFASAFVTPLVHYHPFARVPSALKALILLHFSLSPVRTLAPRRSKRSRSVRLFACKRTHDGSRSLSTFCGYSPCGARVFRLEQVSLASIFLFYKKISHLLHCSSLFAKGHARFACSFASALTAALGRCQPFASIRLAAQEFSVWNKLRLLRFLLQTEQAFVIGI